MILNHDQILAKIKNGSIHIEGFIPENVGANSYDVTLHNELLVYDTIQYSENGRSHFENPIDMKNVPSTKSITIDETKGFVLNPGELYLARTIEKTFTPSHVPILQGRSSIGRLGLFVHVTAGVGDIGFKGYWTLELTCIKPLRIYPKVRIAQIIFFTTTPLDSNKMYSGKYQGNSGIQSSRIGEDFK